LLVAVFLVGGVIGAGAQELLAATNGLLIGKGLDVDETPSGRASPTRPASAQGAGRVFVAGDSLTLQTTTSGAVTAAPPDLQIAAGMGWTAAEAQPPLDAAVAEGPVDTLVVALGTNDSSLREAEGWTASDVERFRQLISTPDVGACVVLVLPGLGPGPDALYAAEMAEARADLRQLADERRLAPDAGPTVVVDWQTVLDRHPEVMAPDGVHLAGDESGAAFASSAAARLDLYWAGVQKCQA
jgi:hypothetical protein